VFQVPQAFQREGAAAPQRLPGAVPALHEADYFRQQLGGSQYQAPAEGGAGFSDGGGGSNRGGTDGGSSAQARQCPLSALGDGPPLLASESAALNELPSNKLGHFRCWHFFGHGAQRLTGVRSPS